MTKKLVTIVTGMQHSGTTYLNNVINSHSKIMSGFECVILLGNIQNFEQIKPFSDWLKTGKTHFGLPDNYLKLIKNKNYEQIYHFIQKNKGSQNDSHVQSLLKKCPYFSDKTPAYIYELEIIYNKVANLNIPVIITLKNYTSIYYSWVVKRNISYDTFIFNLKKCIESMQYIIRTNNQNIFVFEYNDLINKKKIYNEYIMNIIKKYNQNINLEKLFEEKYNHKIKSETKKFKKDENLLKFNFNNIEKEYKKLYDDLLNKLKIKL